MNTVELRRLLADVLAQVDPEIRVEIDGRRARSDTYLATIQGVPTNVVWLSVGWPRQVRELLSRPKAPDLVAATELSPGARKLLTDAGVSWLDRTGAARISLPGLLIRVDPERSARAPKHNLGWTPATLAVCEGLLSHGGGSVSELARATRLAPSTVAASLRFLQQSLLLDAEAVRGRKSRRTIVDRSQLLDAYGAAAERLRSPESIRVGVLWRDPWRGVGELGAQLEELGVAWSVTGALAADVLAPYLTEVAPFEVYADADSISTLRQVAREVGLSEAAGGRLLLRPFPTPARDALSTREGRHMLVCWPRVFVDLRMIGVRGEDAAEHLRERMEATA